jgi:hypothetical protein
MKKFVVACIVIISPTTAVAASFVCDIKHVREVSEDGDMINSPTATSVARSYNRLFWDEGTGKISIIPRNGAGALLERNVHLVQRGTSEISSIGVGTIKGSATTVLMTITVNTWRKNMPFVFHTYSEIYSGTCQRMTAD